MLALPALYAAAWAAGLAVVVWPVVGVAATVDLVRRGRVERPPYLALWAYFAVFVVASAIGLDGAGEAGVWMLRVSWYAVGIVCTLWVCTRGVDPFVVHRVLATCVVALAVVAAFGWLAMVAGPASWAPPVGHLVPAVLGEHPYFQDLISPRLTESQVVGGLTFDRPAAPFPYTNNWGSTVAILVPVAVAVAVGPGPAARRRVPLVLVAAAVPPLVVSLNRGAWLSLTVGAAYGLSRSARLGAPRRVAQLLVVAAVAVLIASTSGFLSSVAERLSTRTAASTEARSQLYDEALEGAKRSPVIGYGAPRPVMGVDGPPVGTQGQLWMVLFSHGVPAAALYAGFFVLSFAALPSPTLQAAWLKAGLLTGMIQIPFYGHLPQQFLVMMVVVALLTVTTDTRRTAPAR